MTDQTKIRNFSIIAHIDRVAPSSISFASAGWRKLIHSAGAPFPAKPAALRLCRGPHSDFIRTLSACPIRDGVGGFA